VLVKLSLLAAAVPNLLTMGSPIPRLLSSFSSPTLKQFARENQQRVQRYREQAEQAAYWRIHPKEKKQLMNTLLSVALLALFVGNQFGKD
jgi:hypothetical protein